MLITINTDLDRIDYSIKYLENPTNDEIARAIAHMEIIKLQLIKQLNFEYEVFKDKEGQENGEEKKE